MKNVEDKYYFTLARRFQRSLDFFPTFMIVSTIALFFLGLYVHYSFMILFFIWPYLMPLGLHRLTRLIWPMEEGKFILSMRPVTPWLIHYKLQLFYYTFPVFEKALIIMGLYSPWLRLWGSKIGKNVKWLPSTIVTDRCNLEIGDNCFFGHSVTMICHVANTVRGKFLFYIKNIKIGNNVFVGAWSNIGPGVQIETNSQLPVGTYLFLNQKVKATDFGPEYKAKLKSERGTLK